MTTNTMVETVRSIFPQMDQSMHKGECGKIAIIGGSRDYTGAPYFAAISALKLGADLSHVFCAESATAAVIKTYSPDLIVHPTTDSLSQWLPSFDAVLVGPGLGRDEDTFDQFQQYIKLIKQLNLPLVIDADGLYFLNKDVSLISCYKNALLTPNVIEFGRLFRLVFQTDPQSADIDSGRAVIDLAQSMGNLTIVQKGPRDMISNGTELLICDQEGSVRRCGGQGDLLSGCLASLAFWAQKSAADPHRAELELYGAPMVAAFGACLVTRRCAKRAFEQFGRTTTTADMVSCLPATLTSLSLLF